MLTSIVVSIVRSCTRFAIPVVVLSLVLAIGAGFYTARNFSINTDINTLISPDLDWRKRDNQFEQAFDRERLILAVVEAPTPELTSSAAKALAEKLSGDTKNFESVTPLGSGEFFEKNGLLFLPVEEVGQGHRAARIGSAPDRDHGRRSLDPRSDRGAGNRPCRRQARAGQARQCRRGPST